MTIMPQTVDPCPHCEFELDDGDIFCKLRGMKEYAGKSDNEVEIIALSYGWTPQNRRRFTKRCVVQPIDSPQYVMCPECKVVFT